MADTERAIRLPRSPFGAALVQAGMVTQEQLEAALVDQVRTGINFTNFLIERGHADEYLLGVELARFLGMEFVDLAEHSIDPAALALVSEGLARRYMVLPIGFDQGRLLLAMAEPGNIVAVDDIRTMTGREIRQVVAVRSAIVGALDRYRGLDGNTEHLSAEAATQFADPDDLASVREVVEEGPIVKLVNMLINEAISQRASDIHIEPGEYKVRIRYRIDGVLHEVTTVERAVHSGLVSRLKIMADIDIAERRIPQDGRISTQLGDRSLDLRVATLPTVYGEKVVLRILDKSSALLKLADLGFLPEALAQFEASYRKPYGTVLVTGPTGSGKSTTLYATLNTLNDVSKNVITVEDPVEYRLAGINQVQVHPKAGLSFAAALRSILRSDPDVVLVGEIRDAETARIAVEAALTGHLVLSTLHTNDAASTPTRLIEMGLEPFLVASALDCIVAQRLARRLCARCKEPQTLDANDLRDLGWEAEDSGTFQLFKAVGCPACGMTGYRGRFAIHEVLTITEGIERLIVDRRHSEDIRRLAVDQGMSTLRRTGLTHAMHGETSLEEILRVVA